MLVMMMASTPSLKASSRLLFIPKTAGNNNPSFALVCAPAPLCLLLPVNCKRRENSMRKWVSVLSATMTATVYASSASLVPPPADQELARDMLKGLVELNTTHEQGSTAAATAIQGWLSSAGFAAGDVVFLAPPDHPTKGNAKAPYPGKP